GDVVEAVRHMRQIQRDLKELTVLPAEELMTRAKDLGAPFALVKEIAETGKLPVPNFAAGGVATPADAALMMSLGAEAVFVGSGIFKSESPEKTALAIVQAVTHWNNPEELARITATVGAPMKGENRSAIPDAELLQTRGW
ncbi:MAG: pyridoxal 5'-phosphate synthase lyase subunit PdxS, partial [Planctomycetota bacterium]